ncbi:sensor domain-containing diguanylate cyclase [Actinoplanes sp. LDG1-06]|uniref:Sensor domain-containing diguanylate cyclase n=1 Tax=Paractinoplanes ovalisporus TaxID=2810368 RepID=A0ABS2A3S6_9ACTN|nr:sensor domain-containing diguanylate cyclase [Actinoplanes ovalisporus]MBM2614469.1 sensor domain-containing diguanylate cyclase [Actinoplanes ovalisporus]
MMPTGRRRWIGFVLVLALVAGGSAASWLAMLEVSEVQQRHAGLLMDHNADAIQRAVANEASRYTETLADLSAAAAAQSTFTSEDFEVMTSRLNRERLPGASAVSFVVQSQAGEAAETQKYWRERGASHLRLRTAGSADQHYYLIFSRALDTVTPDVGRDLSAAEEPSAALLFARASGSITASHPYVLLKDRKLPSGRQQRSFLLAAPVFRAVGVTGASSGEFMGWMVLSMRGHDFVEETLQAYAGELVKVTLSDLDGTAATAVASTTAPAASLRDPGLRRVRTVRVGERDWQIYVQPTDRLLSDTDRRLPGATLAIGLFVTFLAGGLADSRRRALKRVDLATSALRSDIEQRKAVEARLRESEDQLRHLALHDTLTGLANRALFNERLAHGLRAQSRTGEALAVFFIDLDGFKAVNDGLGHSAGDLLLIESARRLELCARSSDIVARLGGDEFAILAEGLSGAEDTEAIAERIVRSLRTPFDLEGQPVTVSCSVGVAVQEPGVPAHAEALVQAADEAMYAAKSAGKNRYETRRYTHVPPAERAGLPSVS